MLRDRAGRASIFSGWLCRTLSCVRREKLATACQGPWLCAGKTLPPTWLWLSLGPLCSTAGPDFATLWKEGELEIVFEMFSLIFFNAQNHFHSHMGLVEGKKRKDLMQIWGVGWSPGREPECLVDCSSIYQDFPGVPLQSPLLNLTIGSRIGRGSVVSQVPLASRQV
jgi:hypothetical protein